MYYSYCSCIAFRISVLSLGAAGRTKGSSQRPRCNVTASLCIATRPSGPRLIRTLLLSLLHPSFVAIALQVRARRSSPNSICAFAVMTEADHPLHGIVNQALEYLSCLLDSGDYEEEEFQSLLREHQATMKLQIT